MYSFNKISFKNLIWISILSLMPAFSTAQTVQHLFKDPYVNAVKSESPNTQWICTYFGLFRHSGGQLKHFTTQNSPLTVNHVTDMHLDAQGNKWFTTFGGGLFKLSDTTWQHFPNPTSSVGGNYINGFVADNQNNIWLASGAGLFKFGLQTHQWTHFLPPTTPTTLYKVVIDARNNIWCRTNNSLLKFDGAQWTDFPTQGNDKNLCIDSQGHLWVGFGVNGLMKFDGNLWTTHNIPNNFNNRYLARDIAIDAQNNKWITTEIGIFKFDGTNWTHFNTANSGLSSDQVNSIDMDAQGNKWVGCGDGNIMKFDGTNWHSIRLANSGLLDNDVLIIATDPQNNKWFGGMKGVSKFDGVRWTEYKIGAIRCMAFDRMGNQWFGTMNGLYKLSDTIWTHYNTANSGLMQNIINCISIDSQNNKWLGLGIHPLLAGSDGGLCKFDDVHWTRYDTLNSGLRSNDITAIAVDRQQNKWLGTSAGLTKFDGTNWTTYPTANQLPIGTISCIAIDNQNNKWIGMRSGILKFDNLTWKHYPLEHLAPNPIAITSINIDRLQQKWFSFGANGFGVLRDTSYTIYPSNTYIPNYSYIITSAFSIDSQDVKWVGYWQFGANRLGNCEELLDLSVRVMNGNVSKPLIHNGLTNEMVITSANPNYPTKIGNFDATGHFLMSRPPQLAFKINRKSVVTEGLPELDGTDAFKMNLICTEYGDAPPIPQFLAMDVNGDSKVDTLDLSALITRSLNLQSGFAQVRRDTQAWRFFPMRHLTARPDYQLSTTFPNDDGIGVSRHRLPADSVFRLDNFNINHCDTTSQQVVGVLLGDGDGSAFNSDLMTKDLLTDTLVTFDGLNAVRIGQDTFRVPVYANQRMFGFGMKIENYSNEIQILSVSDVANGANFGKLNAAKRRYGMIGYSKLANGIAPQTPFCYVTVKTNCPFPRHFGTMTAYLNGKLVRTEVNWNLCTQAEDAISNADFQLYPNPATDRLTITFPPSVSTMRLVNAYGQLVKTLEMNDLGRLELDINALPNGMYFLNVAGKMVQKFVKTDTN
jgi:ligand-binding sensor domain-containing protein